MRSTTSDMALLIAAPDHLRSQISFSGTCNIPKHREHENKENLFELNVYFVRILIRFDTYSNNSQTL